jgi:vitamin B12/bleomycin/antimicrobial peptide transport system ATP-binding/permease protein
VVESEGTLAYESLTLSARTDDGLLLEKLSATVPFRSRVLVKRADPSAGNALFMATAGVWTAGEGRILRPRDILFLAQQPYLPPGSLRQVLTHPGRQGELADERIVSGLQELNLDHLLNRAGGMDVEQNWETLISLREQQLFAFLRVLLAAPQFVFADRAWATLTSNERANSSACCRRLQSGIFAIAKPMVALIFMIRSSTVKRAAAGRGHGEARPYEEASSERQQRGHALNRYQM